MSLDTEKTDVIAVTAEERVRTVQASAEDRQRGGREGEAAAQKVHPT